MAGTQTDTDRLGRNFEPTGQSGSRWFRRHTFFGCQSDYRILRPEFAKIVGNLNGSVAFGFDIPVEQSGIGLVIGRGGIGIWESGHKLACERYFIRIAPTLRQAADTEFVSVEDRDDTVHILKAGGNLLIKVIEKHGRHEKGQNVDIKVPLPVVQALVSGPKDQLDLMAGLRALEAYGDTTLITVNDEEDRVRIWVDTRSSSD